MAPKGGNAKKESGRAKKAENEAKKQHLAEEEKERKESAKWGQGAKGKGNKEDKDAKRQQALAAKAERERLLAEEEASLPSKAKATPKAGAKKKATTTPRPAGPGSLAAGGGLAAGSDPASPGAEKVKTPPEEIESFSASNIDDAISMLEVVNAKKDKASIGQAAAGLEKHPERRFKAVFEAYQERELSDLRKERPGLRLNQYKELLFKQFQKSPENPFNQTVVAYDATKEERLEVLEKRNKDIEERLKDRTQNLTLDD